MIQVNAVSAPTSAQAAEQVSQTEGTASFSSYLNGSVSMDDIFNKASKTYGISVDLLKAVAKAESNFNPNAVSRCGAQGVMQLMPATAASLGVTDAFDPEQNIMAGANYLKQMLDKFDGNVTFACAAYNAGANNVTKYGGVPPFKETQNYVAKIAGYLNEGVQAPGDAVYTSSAPAAANNSVPLSEQKEQLTSDFSLADQIFSYDSYLDFLEIFMNSEQEKKKEQEEQQGQQGTDTASYLKFNGAALSLMNSLQGL